MYNRAMNQNNGRKSNRYTPLIIVGVMFVILACIFFPFIEENTLNVMNFLSVTFFLVGIFLLCLPSMIEKRRKKNSSSTSSEDSHRLEPPRRIVVEHTEIEDDSDRFEEKHEDYRKKQEQYHHADEAREENKKDEHIVCPYCGFINSPGRQECLLCHKELEEPCPKCGKKNPAGSQICHHCGATIEKKK